MAVEDSVCTKELHEQAAMLERIARDAYDGETIERRYVHDLVSGTYTAIERVSRRVDGEAAARLELQSAVLEVVDILSRVSRSVDDKRLDALRLILAQP